MIIQNDGGAYIIENEKIFLFKPPFSNKIECSIKDVAKAIHSYGFEECDVTFDKIDEVIKYIKDVNIKKLKSDGWILGEYRGDLSIELIEKIKNELKKYIKE